MRIAVVSDIHGNWTALQAVMADLRDTAPDLILHGGDLADSGSNPALVVDTIRDLGWAGVAGNTDEMLFRPESLTEFAAPLPQLAAMFGIIGEIASDAREKLGEDRLAWLRALPARQIQGPLAFVHASPASFWRAPAPEAGDQELQTVYAELGRPIAGYGHIHRPYIRRIGELTVVNSGSVSLSYDGDARASYLLIDDGRPSIRRVEYDVRQESAALGQNRIPHAGWIARMLASGKFEMP